MLDALRGPQPGCGSERPFLFWTVPQRDGLQAITAVLGIKQASLSRRQNFS